MAPPKIQIAFQGGGAKFLAMLPICHAFSQCEAEEKIEISAVAGTSAGAICAALVAAKCNFAALRAYLKSNGSKHLSNLIDPATKNLSEALQDESISVLKILSVRKKISDIFKNGFAALNENEFGIFLDKILAHCEDGDKKIEELSKDLYITSTDLAKSRGITHASGSIKVAMRDSCALPILFRSFDYLSINHNVDGGLCNNLPVECLLGDESAPIFAVFAEETLDKTPVGSMFKYLLTLFDASISHNTERSKDYIYDPFRIPVKTDYSTFSFAEALKIFADDDWYNRIYGDTYQKICEFITNYGEVDNKNYYRFIDTKSIYDYIASLENATNGCGEFIEIKHSGLTIKVNCGDKFTTRPRRRLADNITRKVKFKIADQRFRYYKSTVSMDENGIAVPTVWHAYNETRKAELPIRVLSLDNIVGEKKGHVRCVVEFLKPEENMSVDDLIQITDTYSIKDGMIKLNFGRPDEVNAQNLHEKDLEKVEAILSYPKRLGNLDVEFDPSGSSILESTVKKLRRREVEGFDQIEIGMSAENVPPNGSFRYIIVHK